MSATAADKSNGEPVQRCSKSDEQVGFQRPLGERNIIKMGEAPVKYELTGASCHYEPKLAVWRRPIKCLLGPLGNRLRPSFFRHRRVIRN